MRTDIGTRLPQLIVIGGGLAGCEAAWQAAIRGVRVALYEMRPYVQTGAHLGGDMAELICSNSFGSNLPDRASGLLKTECRRLGSLLIRCADETSLPAGRALAVDRGLFSRLVTSRILSHPNIELVRMEIKAIPDIPSIIASGPLTSDALAGAIAGLTGKEHLYFYDAIAPIVRIDTIDKTVTYRASRYNQNPEEQGDYLNCPLSRNQYDIFVDELVKAERIELRSFEHQLKTGVSAGAHSFFEGCLPIEVLAGRDRRALAYGPMRPVGLVNPHTGVRPFAVVQLRQDNLSGSLYNLVGFQTNLKFSEQKRVFRLIPGLQNAEFERYGQMHRNTFIYSPGCLLPTLQFIGRPDIFFAGQITGVEGYMGNIATGLLAGINAARLLEGKEPLTFPRETMIGALCYYVTHATAADFQPMKSNFGIMPELVNKDSIRGKRARGMEYSRRASTELDSFINNLKILDNSHSHDTTN